MVCIYCKWVKHLRSTAPNLMIIVISNVSKTACKLIDVLTCSLYLIIHFLLIMSHIVMIAKKKSDSVGKLLTC